jgi:hypothetical protein
VSALTALWIAVVHAFVLGTAVGGARADASTMVPARWAAAVLARSAVPAADAATPARSTSGDQAGHREARPVQGAVQVAPTVVGVLAARGDIPRGPEPWSPQQGTGPRTTAGADLAAAVRARALEHSHAVSARGALLPYYPTAPPLQS